MNRLINLEKYNNREETLDIIEQLENIFVYIENEDLVSKTTSNEKSKFILEMLIAKKLNTFVAEKSISNINRNDKIDIYGEVGNYVVIIELDNMRADQVCKKLFSRSLLFDIKTEIIYISILYSTNGNRKADINECYTYIKGHFKEFINRNRNIQYLVYAPEQIVNNLKK